MGTLSTTANLRSQGPATGSEDDAATAPIVSHQHSNAAKDALRITAFVRGASDRPEGRIAPYGTFNGLCASAGPLFGSKNALISVIRTKDFT